MIRVSAKQSAVEIRTAILAMRRLPADLRRDMNSNVRTVFNPVWQEEIGYYTQDPLDQIFLKGARIKTGNPPTLIAAASKRKITKSGGGLIPVQHWAGFEYGAKRGKRPYARVSKLGTRHKVERDTTRHLRSRTTEGRVLGRAMVSILPRISSYWSKSVIASLLDAMEEGR